MVSETTLVSKDARETDTDNKPKSGLWAVLTTRRATGLIIRLCIWYVLLTPLFCRPARPSDLNSSSSSSTPLCKPYLAARSHCQPYILPYYHNYAAPYIDWARPYAVTLNEQAFSPAASAAKQGYDKYGAPILDRIWKFTWSQWDAYVVPRLQLVRDYTNEVYKSVEPHVQCGRTAVSPCHRTTNKELLRTYWDYIFLYYARSRPFIGKTYASGQSVLATTILPYAQSIWSSIVYFADSELLPKISGLYTKNVEPQLVKIGRKLASYKKGERLGAVLDEFDGRPDTVALTTNSGTTEVKYTSTASTTSSGPETWATQITTEIPSLAEETVQVREKVDSDLRRWQEKFTVAIDEATGNLEERLQWIIESRIEAGAKNIGRNLASTLESTIEAELSTVKWYINSLAGSLPLEDVPTDEEYAQSELLYGIRDAAISIRDHAHNLREWYNSFNDELEHQISKAVNSTLDILESICDLGLQEIGIRWAWMDGVTYEDWERYHALKSWIGDWEEDIRDMAMQHRKAEEARDLSSKILFHGMDAAEASAKELNRLRVVGNWKIAARDTSDSFDTRFDPPPAWPKPASEPETIEMDATGLEDISQCPIYFTDIAFGTQTSPAFLEKAGDVRQDVSISRASLGALEEDRCDLPILETRPGR